MHSAHLMELPEFHGFLPMMRKRFEGSVDIDDRFIMKLARTHFADMTISQLFTLVSGFGVSTFCLYNLGLVTTTGPGVLTPIEGIEGALSILKIAGVGSFDIKGDWAILLNGFYGIALLYYTVFFISLSSRIIDTAPKNVQDFDMHSLEKMLWAVLGKPPTQSTGKEIKDALHEIATAAQAASLREQDVVSSPVSNLADATTSEATTNTLRK